MHRVCEESVASPAAAAPPVQVASELFQSDPHQNYLLVFLSKPVNAHQLLRAADALLSHCTHAQTHTHKRKGNVLRPQNKAQGLLWVLKKCLWMQQQVFLRPDLLVFISGARVVIRAFRSESISQPHFRISAWSQKISRLVGVLQLQISWFFLTVPAPCMLLKPESSCAVLRYSFRSVLFKIKLERVAWKVYYTN